MSFGTLCFITFKTNEVIIATFHLCPILDSNQEFIKTVFLFLHVVKLTAQLQQIPKELHCQINISHVLTISTQRAIQLESNAVPSFMSLVKWMYYGETIERIILEIQTLIRFASLDHVKSEFTVLTQVQVLVSCLF